MKDGSVTPRRRREVVAALRRGTVPSYGLDLLAVGLERFTPALDVAAGGGAAFKAVRGEYGAGKTFLARYLAERALRRGFAAAEVQVSETETPLHMLDSWLFTLESDVTAASPGLAGPAVDAAVEQLLASSGSTTRACGCAGT